MIKIPVKLNTDKDLDVALDYFYSREAQNSDLRHLRFGQFIFNTYDIEINNSYNIKDPYLAYKELLLYFESL